MPVKVKFHVIRTGRAVSLLLTRMKQIIMNINTLNVQIYLPSFWCRYISICILDLVYVCMYRDIRVCLFSCEYACAGMHMQHVCIGCVFSLENIRICVEIYIYMYVYIRYECMCGCTNMSARLRTYEDASMSIHNEVMCLSCVLG